MEDVNKQLLDAAKLAYSYASPDGDNYFHSLDQHDRARIDAAIAAAEQAQQAEPVARDVIAKLIALTRAVNIALDDSEERDGIDGREHVIDSVNFDAVCDALELLEELPDNKPGWAMNAADKAAWALRHLTAAAPQAAPLSAALADIAAERRRQIEVEGWTPERDDKYNDCQLAAAAATYALCTNPDQLKICGATVWPWPLHWWKPTTYRRNLVKSGAMIAAEIERIDRAAQKGSQ